MPGAILCGLHIRFVVMVRVVLGYTCLQSSTVVYTSKTVINATYRCKVIRWKYNTCLHICVFWKILMWVQRCIRALIDRMLYINALYRDGTGQVLYYSSYKMASGLTCIYPGLNTPPTFQGLCCSPKIPYL